MVSCLVFFSYLLYGFARLTVLLMCTFINLIVVLYFVLVLALFVFRCTIIISFGFREVIMSDRVSGFEL